MLRHPLFHSVIAAIVLLAAACASPQASAPLAVATAAPAKQAATAAPAAAAAPTKAPAAAAPAAPNAAPTPLSPVVAILVVDSFDNKLDKPPRPKDWTPSKNEYCLATPDGQGYRSDGATVSTSGTTPHGVLVYNQVVQLLVQYATPVQGSTRIWKPKGPAEDPPNYIVLLSVPITGFDTKAAADGIVAATNALSSGLTVDGYRIGGSGSEIRGVVVNMSFAVVPCKSDNLTAQTYITKIETLTDVKELRSAINKLYQPDLDKNNRPLYTSFKEVVLSEGIPADSLHCLMLPPKTHGCLPRDDWKARNLPTIFVAAAGNSGTKDLTALKFPFAPALWPEVLSVSASDATDPLDVTSTNKATYSNSGEVMVSGVHYETTNQGTSFAAPKLAYLAARYLLTCKDNCQMQALKDSNKSANKTLQVAAMPYPPFPTKLP